MPDNINRSDLDTFLMICGAIALLVIGVSLWIENKIDVRRLRQVEEANQRISEEYGCNYRDVWHEAEARFWSRLGHSDRIGIDRNLSDHAIELAAIRAQITGTEMDHAAACREIRQKILQ